MSVQCIIPVFALQWALQKWVTLAYCVSMIYIYIWGLDKPCKEKRTAREGGHSSMARQNMQQHAYRITRFLTVQLIALIGWIIVQSTFSLSPLGRTIPFTVTMVIEAIWWMATLVIMFLLFKREYNRFVQAVLELDTANKRLRETTNSILLGLRNQSDQDESISRSE